MSKTVRGGLLLDDLPSNEWREYVVSLERDLITARNTLAAAVADYERRMGTRRGRLLLKILQRLS